MTSAASAGVSAATGVAVEPYGSSNSAWFLGTQTTVNRGEAENVGSSVGALKVGLSYRILFWKSETAPDFVAKAGYGLFVFPLRGSPFPGTRYSNLYIGGMFTV